MFEEYLSNPPLQRAPKPSIQSCTKAWVFKPKSSIKEGAVMYKTIMVLLDGSKLAEGILPHVENLAKRYGARVILVQIIEPIHILTNEPAIVRGKP
jgi:hypothetical protein